MKKWMDVVLLLILLLEPWAVSLVRCEILTHKYCTGEIRETCASWPMAGTIRQIKMLDYSRDMFCKVYVREDDGGSVYYLLRDKESEWKWKIIGWDTIWTTGGGNADGFVWPYIR